MKKLKQRWGVSSNLQLAIIFIVFSITGSSAVYAAKPFLNWIGLNRENFSPDFLWGGLIYLIFRILLIFPIYQFLLVIYGWLFGQFKFFWEFEKKMLSRMGLGFILKWMEQYHRRNHSFYGNTDQIVLGNCLISKVC